VKRFVKDDVLHEYRGIVEKHYPQYVEEYVKLVRKKPAVEQEVITQRWRKWNEQQQRHPSP